jgi:hypothetical protein
MGGTRSAPLPKGKVGWLVGDLMQISGSGVDLLCYGLAWKSWNWSIDEARFDEALTRCTTMHTFGMEVHPSIEVVELEGVLEVSKAA